MKRLVVIGAGVAGLSAAIHGRSSGYEVDVYERHTIPGGLCTAWRIDGFRFDGCIEWLTGSGPASPFYPLWREVGVLPRAVVDRPAYAVIRCGEQSLTLWADPDRLEAELVARSPADALPGRELAALVRTMRTARYRVDRAEALMSLRERIGRVFDAFAAREAWSAGTAHTVGDFAARFTDPLIRRALETAMDPRLPLVALLTTLADLANGASGTPVGGSLPVALSMARRARELGARLHLSHPVARIEVDDRRVTGVTLEDGTRVEADVVVAAADLRQVLDRWLGGRWPSPPHEELFRSRPLMSSVCIVSFGLAGALPPVGDAVVQRLILTPPREVAGHVLDVVRWRAWDRDDTSCPPGTSMISATIPSDRARWVGFAREDYERHKRMLADGVAAALEEVLPDLRARIRTVDVATPTTIEAYTGNHGGSFMTFVPPTGGPPPVVPRQIAGLRGLWLAGMWVAPPGGLPNALKSGRDAIELACHAEGRRFRPAPPVAEEAVSERAVSASPA